MSSDSSSHIWTNICLMTKTLLRLRLWDITQVASYCRNNDFRASGECNVSVRSLYQIFNFSAGVLPIDIYQMTQAVTWGIMIRMMNNLVD